MTHEEFIEKFPKWYESRRHIVIIGAGASIAALPKGDYYGNKTSCMSDIVKDINLQDIISKLSLKTESQNIEDIYSELCERNDCAEAREQIERAIYNYYSKIRIPNNLTIYDLLVLSLRNKDIIVSFNWDSLLLQAHMRWQNEVKDLPQLLFLHGNVGIGVCDDCRRPYPIRQEDGTINNECPKCHRKLRQLQLLYPVRNKDYNKDPFIKAQWDYIQDKLYASAITTVFGYKAPVSDIVAMEMIKKAFTKYGEESRQFDDLEIIERPGFNQEELSQSWWDIAKIVKNHVYFYESFFDSTLARYPRRTIEAAKIYNLDGKFVEPICQFKKEDLNTDAFELMKKMKGLLQQEMHGDYSIAPMDKYLN